MFTGIIQHLGRVLSIKPADFGAELVIDSSGWSHDPSPGQSIAVNGCCLTLVESPQRGHLRFDVVRQTLDVTAMGRLKVGDEVNLEHAVTPQTLLGGHIVQGHVDAVGVVERVVENASEHRVRIKVAQIQAMEAVVEKGSIAINGVSLTIASTGENWLEVALIPTTLRLTNLGRLREGDAVNLETDYIAKAVVNWLRRTRQ